jgi:hypothetical protein
VQSIKTSYPPVNRNELKDDSLEGKKAADPKKDKKMLCKSTFMN